MNSGVPVAEKRFGGRLAFSGFFRRLLGRFAGETVFPQDLLNLVVNVAPFAHAAVGEKVLLAPLFHPSGCFFPFQRVVELLPDIEQGHQIGERVHKYLLGLVSCLGAICRAFSRVLDTQGSGNNRDIRDAVVLTGFHQHSG